MITETPKLENKSIYEVLMFNQQEDMDICDNIFDWACNIGCRKSFEDCTDYYDKLMLLFCLNIQCENYKHDWYSCCKITDFIEANKEVFDKFMEEENKDQYKPSYYKNVYGMENVTSNDEDFYDLYLMTFQSLIVGNYCESDYEKLYKALGGK